MALDPIFMQEIKNGVNRHVTESFFDMLHTNEGFLSLQAWYRKYAGAEMDEYQFVKLLKDVSQDITEVKAFEVFDMMTIDTFLTFKEFVYLIFFLASAQCQQTTAFLYMHGEIIFTMISGKEGYEVSLERLRKLGRLLGLSERYLINKAQSLRLGSRVSMEQFTLFYFEVFSEWDYQVEVQEPYNDPQDVSQHSQISIRSEQHSDRRMSDRRLSDRYMPAQQEQVQMQMSIPQEAQKAVKKKLGCNSRHCTLL